MCLFHTLRIPDAASLDRYVLGHGKEAKMAEMTGNDQDARMFTQEEVNALIGARLDRERAKFADYDELKKDAEAYRASIEAEKSELTRAQERIAELEAAKAARDAADARAEVVARVMREHSVDVKYAALLTADDEEGLIAQAKLVGERFAEPSKNDGKKPVRVSGDSEAEQKQFASSLFAGR